MTLAIELIKNPLLDPIILRCKESASKISGHKHGKATQGRDFVYPFSQTVLAGFQAGELGYGMIGKFLRKKSISTYKTLIQTNRQELREARCTLDEIFDSAYELGLEFREARLASSNNPEIDRGASEVARHFISSLAESLELEIDNPERFASEVWRMYRNNYIRLAQN